MAKTRGEFLSNPRPEAVSTMSFLPGPDLKPKSTFKVGIQLITKDNSGLNIVPTYDICFEIDGESFCMSSGMLGGLLPRLKDFCDTADRMNKEAVYG